MLHIQSVVKSFGTKIILKGVNLDIKSNRSLVLLGGSGSGKSVLLKSILGILTPNSGSIKIDGLETVGVTGSKRNAILQKFGMLFQGGALFDSLSVWENITFGVRQRQKITKKEAIDLAVHQLELVGLSPDIAILYPSELSGGMQKRVALARAICSKPNIIFFDEPTTGLDPIMANVINDLIVDITHKIGATAVTITHDMESMRRIADEVAVLYQGQIIWHNKADKIWDCDHPFVYNFIRGITK